MQYKARNVHMGQGTRIIIVYIYGHVCTPVNVRCIIHIISPVVHTCMPPTAVDKPPIVAAAVGDQWVWPLLEWAELQ